MKKAPARYAISRGYERLKVNQVDCDSVRQHETTLDLAQGTHCIIDSLAVPVVQFYYVPQAGVEWNVAGATFGHSCSKKQAIFGDKLRLLVTQSGVIRDFELEPANLPDLTIGSEVLAGHADLQVLGDKGYVSRPVAAKLRAECNSALLAVPRNNQRARPSEAFCHQHAHLCQLIETLNHQLALQAPVETYHAHSFRGLAARLYTKLAAHTLYV